MAGIITFLLIAGFLFFIFSPGKKEGFSVIGVMLLIVFIFILFCIGAFALGIMML